MKKLKGLIILIIIIIFIIIAAIIYINNTEKKEYIQYISTQGDKEIEGERKVYKLDSKYTYFSVKDCIQRYYNNINNNMPKILYNIIDDNYIKENKITEDNIFDIIIKSGDDKKYEILEIYYLEAKSQIPYFIKGVLYNNKGQEDKFFTVILDLANDTFSIKPCSEDEYNQNINGEIEYDEKEILQNEYNSFNSPILSDEDLARKYFYDYIENVVYYPTYAYKTLDETYSQKRFGNYENYRNYLKTNIDNYKLMEMNRAKSKDEFKSDEDYKEYLSQKYYAGFLKYTVNKTDEYTQYICSDFNDNYYIFNVFNDFSYKVILDTYTMDLPQFIEKYNSANIQERVVMNIDRIFKALNAKDYKFAYNYLADGFKNNQFKDINAFATFIQKNVYDKCTVEYGKFTNEGETYIYDIIIKNSDNNSQIKKMQIIMKLEEETKFVMSFNIK